MTEHKKHLYYMNELSGYKISDGYPDVRGWDVKDFDNRVIGKVDNLLVNVEAERVVYLDVEVDKSVIDAKHDPYGRPSHLEVREFVNKDGENHIIIPIGLVDLNTDSNYVYTDILDHQTFAETKRYRKGDNVGRAYENQVLDSYGRRDRIKRSDDEVIITDNEVNKIDYDENRIHEKKIDYDQYLSENRMREIVREEIRKYHENNDGYSESTDTNLDVRRRRYSDDADDNVILTDEENELDRRRRNDDVHDDDRFYERREFDDQRFRKNRTPGL